MSKTMSEVVSSHTLSVYMRVAHTETLGPGKRYALWVQGCPLRCPGCLASDSLPTTGGELISIEALAEEILHARQGLEGITISGGEPFMQAEALVALIQRLRREWDVGVIVYTGFTLEQLQRQATSARKRAVGELLTLIDLLIDGPFKQELNDGLSLRGSSNQAVTPLTDRYLEALSLYGQPGRKVELLLHDHSLNMVGVPPAALLERLQPSPTAPSLQSSTKELFI